MLKVCEVTILQQVIFSFLLARFPPVFCLSTKQPLTLAQPVMPVSTIEQKFRKKVQGLEAPAVQIHL